MSSFAFSDSFSIDSGLDFDEGFNLRWVSWKGYDVLGITNLPFDLASYPIDRSKISILSLDTEDDFSVRYPRVRVGYQDSGRAIRLRFTDGGDAIDLSSATILVYSFRQSDDVAVRSGYDISTSITYAEDGFVEWGLSSTYETTNSIYFYLKITIGTDVSFFPSSGYLYVDVFNPATLSASSPTAGIRPKLTIPIGTIGKTYSWMVYQNERSKHLDLGIATGKIYAYNITRAITPSMSANNLSGLTSSGSASYVMQSGDLSQDGYLLAWLKLTKNSKTITVPVEGFFPILVEDK